MDLTHRLELLGSNAPMVGARPTTVMLTGKPSSWIRFRSMSVRDTTGIPLVVCLLGTRHAQAAVEATVCMVMHQYYASPSPPSSCDCFLSPRHQPAFLDRCSRIIINSWGRATTLGENGNSHMDCNYYHISFLLGRRAFHLKR